LFRIVDPSGDILAQKSESVRLGKLVALLLVATVLCFTIENIKEYYIMKITAEAGKEGITGVEKIGNLDKISIASFLLLIYNLLILITTACRGWFLKDE